MAGFCKYCGKALQDGEICSCPQAQAEAAQEYQGQQPEQLPQLSQQNYQQPPQGYQPPQQNYQQPPQGYQPPQQNYQQPPQGYQPPPQGYQAPQFQQAPAAPNPVTTAASDVAPYFKSYFRSPIAAARDLIARKNLGLALMLLLIQAVAGGLVLFSVQRSFCSTLESLIEKNYGGSYHYYSRRIVSVDPSVPMSLLFGVLAAVAAIAIFAVVVFAIAKIMGSSCAFKDVVIACGANSIIVTLLLLLSFVFFFMVWILGCIFLLTAMVAWMVLAVPTLQAVTPNSDQGKFWICTVIGILAALLIGGWASTKLASTAFNPVSITVDDETQTMDDILELADRELSAVSSGDMGDLFEVGVVMLILYWNW